MPTTREHGESDDLIERAALGDEAARQGLLGLHRGRLRRMVAVRMDRRLSARVDPSDVVQEALADATRHLDDYLRDRPLPFYPWLRRLAWERLVDARRRHLVAARRSVGREERRPIASADDTSCALADRLVSAGASPSHPLRREERRSRVLAALAGLPGRDREILVLRYLEGLSTGEIASLLDLKLGAVMTRHTRALARLRGLLDDDSTGDGA